MEAKERLIVALDVKTPEEAIGLIDVLSPVVDVFKVGIAPFTGYGQQVLEKIKETGKKVFLDLKFHDIPNTVRNAAYISTAKGVFMLNFHCLGGEEMMRAAAEGAKQARADTGKEAPILLGVTILTSMDEGQMRSVGLAGDINSRAIDLARLADKAGMDGVVASARETAGIKKNIGKDFVVVTPGVRPEWASAGDQKRVVTPKKAIENGSDYIVVGRPIIQAPDPRDAARRIIKEMGT